jgi:hypothetical protein
MEIVNDNQFMRTGLQKENKKNPNLWPGSGLLKLI